VASSFLSNCPVLRQKYSLAAHLFNP
jgi:hypothetical protein